jgi:hypothetical protein
VFTYRLYAVFTYLLITTQWTKLRLFAEENKQGKQEIKSEQNYAYETINQFHNH